MITEKERNFLRRYSANAEAYLGAKYILDTILKSGNFHTLLPVLNIPQAILLNEVLSSYRSETLGMTTVFGEGERFYWVDYQTEGLKFEDFELFHELAVRQFPDADLEISNIPRVVVQVSRETGQIARVKITTVNPTEIFFNKDGCGLPYLWSDVSFVISDDKLNSGNFGNYSGRIYRDDANIKIEDHELPNSVVVHLVPPEIGELQMGYGQRFAYMLVPGSGPVNNVYYESNFAILGEQDEINGGWDTPALDNLFVSPGNTAIYRV